MKNLKKMLSQWFKAPAVNVFYWDKKKNFGDKIGPYLVEKMANKETANIFQRKEETEGLLVVGSIIGMLDRPGLDIWGSGLIRPLSASKVKQLQAFPPRKILAVRGYKTYSQLRKKLGWDVPKILGDPALLLPKYFTPDTTQSSTHGKIAIVPHYSHASLFKHLHNEGGLRVLDVADEPLEVVNDIATAKVCLSTSLHGIIVAHAYGVPWVWLQITDNQLRGDTFKFEDFFTVLDRSAVSHKAFTQQEVQGMTVSTISEMVSSAALPTNKFDFTDLENALLEHFYNLGICSK